VLEAKMLWWDTELKWRLYSSDHTFQETASEILLMGIPSPSLVFANKLPFKGGGKYLLEAR
jgi:hypothetical protein